MIAPEHAMQIKRTKSHPVNHRPETACRDLHVVYPPRIGRRGSRETDHSNPFAFIGLGIQSFIAGSFLSSLSSLPQVQYMPT